MCVVHTVYYCCTGRNLYKISTNFYLYKFPMVNGVGKNKTNRISFTTYGDVTSNNICCLFGIFFRSLHSVCVPSFISSRREMPGWRYTVYIIQCILYSVYYTRFFSLWTCSMLNILCANILRATNHCGVQFIKII